MSIRPPDAVQAPHRARLEDLSRDQLEELVWRWHGEMRQLRQRFESDQRLAHILMGIVLGATISAAGFAAGLALN